MILGSVMITFSLLLQEKYETDLHKCLNEELVDTIKTKHLDLSKIRYSTLFV